MLSLLTEGTHVQGMYGLRSTTPRNGHDFQEPLPARKPSSRDFSVRPGHWASKPILRSRHQVRS